MTPPVRVLVTGGEGLVGSAVVRGLLDAGHPVTTLSLPGADPHPGVRVVRGDARDAAAVREALADVEAVAHLAAIPNATDAEPEVVFANNASATFTVLWTAAKAGVRRLVIAGSVNATGLIMNPAQVLPDRYPINENTRTAIADPYSLSKATDELTLAAVCRRFGASGVAIRLPLMVSPENDPFLAPWAAQPDHMRMGAGDGWGWLDTRDGAEVFRLALTREFGGAHVVGVAAPTTFQDSPTEELLDRFAPDVPRGARYPGRSVPVDTSRARELLGFSPRYDDPPHRNAEAH